MYLFLVIYCQNQPREGLRSKSVESLEFFYNTFTKSIEVRAWDSPKFSCFKKTMKHKQKNLAKNSIHWSLYLKDNRHMSDLAGGQKNLPCMQLSVPT